MKKFLKEYFTFSKRERNGLLFLLILIGIVFLLPYAYALLMPSEKTDFSVFQSDIERFRSAIAAKVPQLEERGKDDIVLYEQEGISPAFDFNPNELTYEQGRALGLSHKIALRLTNYLKAGGQFYKKEDLKKIYGLSDKDYQRLAPFAIFEEQEKGWKNKKDKRKNFERKDGEGFAAKKKDYPSFELKLTPFDPNQLTYEEARTLGMSHQAAKALTNFVKKGMVFRKKEDLKKVYGFTDEDYERLQDLVQIEVKEENSTASKDEKSFGKRERPDTFGNFEEEPLLVDINTATAEDWKKLKGIGPSFSNRIVKYRNSLGGFTHPEQLKEVYGLDAILYVEIMGYLTNDVPASIQKINVNTANEERLKKHPYINGKLAKAIVKKRMKKDDFQEISELQKINGMDSALFKKLSPYLSVR